jgi:hypothetical protein
VPSPASSPRIGPIFASSRPEDLVADGRAVEHGAGMQRATASTSDISSHTAARGCGSTKLCVSRVSPPTFLGLANLNADRRCASRARGRVGAW